MDYSNIPTGLKINSQIPLDVKGYALNEATLAYLGVGDNLAFTYHEGLRVVCIEERKVYEWREVGVGEENTGLVAVDFTYPSDLPEVYGIDYSGRDFNFFLVNQITPETLEDYVLEIDLPSYNLVSYGDNSGPSGSDYDIVDIVLDEKIIGNNTEFRLAGLGVKSDSALVRTQYQYILGTGVDSKYSIIIDFVPNINNSVTAKLTGNGSISVPFKVETLNPQKIINTFPYELLDTDNQHTLFVTNASINAEIRVPDTLSDNFTCVIIQEGTGTVTVTTLGSTVLNIPSGLTAVIKGQYHWAMLEKKGATTSHYLGGSLKTTP